MRDLEALRAMMIIAGPSAGDKWDVAVPEVAFLWLLELALLTVQQSWMGCSDRPVRIYWERRYWRIAGYNLDSIDEIPSTATGAFVSNYSLQSVSLSCPTSLAASDVLKAILRAM
jgi:hypothetical protein